MKTHTKAFTLIELLVVIAIIGILISLTTPSLTSARQAALRTKCFANLRAIGIGIHIHAGGNQGEFPYGRQYVGSSLTRNTWYTNLTPSMDSSRAINDAVYTYQEDRILVPEPPDYTPGRAGLYNEIWWRLMCPSQREPVYGIVQGVRPTYGYVVVYTEADYRNGRGVYVAGRDTGINVPRLVDLVVRPSVTAVAMDAGWDYVHPTWYRSALVNNALETRMPDRHNGYSTLFVDGHVRRLPVEVISDPTNEIWQAY